MAEAPVEALEKKRYTSGFLIDKGDLIEFREAERSPGSKKC